MQILHVTAHMGGGAGNAISNIIEQDKWDEHRLIALQHSAKRQYITCCQGNGIPVMEEPSTEQMMDWLNSADVIVLHWWQHPLMCAFLAEFPKELYTRVVLWSHISGCGYPHLREEFALLFERIFVTTPFSYENEGWSEDGRERIKERSSVLYGIGNLDENAYAFRKHDEVETCTIGYVGTLAKSKLHPLFLDYCQCVIEHVKRCRFLMVGDTGEAGWLQDEIERRGLKDYFIFTGYCDNVAEQLAKMDVFGYPLNPNHFGTTENAVLEAMLCCLPVVMLRQNTEKYIAEDGKTGFLVDSPEEYATAIAKLCGDTNLRNIVGSNAREMVMQRYSAKINCEKFRHELEQLCLEPAQRYDFEAICGKYPYQWFLAGMDDKTRDIFEGFLQGDISRERLGIYLKEGMEIFLGESKSSIRHFRHFFPMDDVMKGFDVISEL